MKKIIISFSILFFIFSCAFNISYAKENDTNLQTLRLDVEGLEPMFKENIYKYYLTVSTYVENIDVIAIPKNTDFDVQIDGNKNLKNGLNIITIEVISKDKKLKRTYTIEVTKTDDRILANSNLETLAIKDALLNPPFDSVQTNYETEVANDVINLDILAIPENENANILVKGKDNLKIGDNLVIINVTAPNGFTKKIYQINVKRRNEQEEIKNNQEINQMPQKLENAYEIERVSIRPNEKNIENKNNLNMFILGILILTITGGIFAIIIVKKKY